MITKYASETVGEENWNNIQWKKLRELLSTHTSVTTVMYIKNGKNTLSNNQRKRSIFIMKYTNLWV